MNMIYVAQSQKLDRLFRFQVVVEKKKGEKVVVVKSVGGTRLVRREES